MDGQDQLFPEASFSFGPRFLHDHAGHIITDPRIAIVELVANSYDAGASRVDIQWPESAGGALEVCDNGTGMTVEEFNQRWRTLSYSRPQEQGLYVEYPPGVKASKRIAFGQNGKGRYSPFCFADDYEVDTWKDSAGVHAQVALTEGGSEPFHCTLSEQPEKHKEVPLTGFLPRFPQSLVGLPAIERQVSTHRSGCPFFARPR